MLLSFHNWTIRAVDAVHDHFAVGAQPFQCRGAMTGMPSCRCNSRPHENSSSSPSPSNRRSLNLERSDRSCRRRLSRIQVGRADAGCAKRRSLTRRRKRDRPSGGHPARGLRRWCAVVVDPRRNGRSPSTSQCLSLQHPERERGRYPRRYALRTSALACSFSENHSRDGGGSLSRQFEPYLRNLSR